MQKKVLGCQLVTGTRKSDGKSFSFYRIYISTDDGAVGALISNREYKVGDLITLGLTVWNNQIQVAVL